MFLRRRFLWLYSAAWLFFFGLYSLMLISGRETSIAQALNASFFTVTPAALMGILVWKLASRFPWTGKGRVRFFTIHLVCALIYGLAWSGITLAQIAIFAPANILQIFIERALGWQVMMGILMYGMIAGIAYVVQVTDRLAEQRMLTSRAELQTLRAQLNPHFLFNTLHSITSLAQQDGAQTEEALVRFGSLLRYVLDSSRRTGEDATLEEELTFVRGYLGIEKMRLGERLQVTEDIDPEALECVIPVLTLQPIVENAIEHGIAPRASGGTISIKARMDDGRLSVVVNDDGVGADAKQIVSSNGIGLSLVRKRLGLRFADQALMNIDTSEGNGMTVTLSLPAT